jgi:hypothetical protein
MVELIIIIIIIIIININIIKNIKPYQFKEKSRILKTSSEFSGPSNGIACVQSNGAI